MMFIMPRVRGAVGEVLDPPELKGQYAWAIYIVLVVPGKPELPVGEIHSHELSPARFFLSEQEAKRDLEREIVGVCAELNKAAGGTGKEGFLDMLDEMKHKTEIVVKR